VKKWDTFTVESGVVIELAKDASVIIEGRINIAGYPRGGEVIFKAVDPSQNYNKGFWQGVIIHSIINLSSHFILFLFLSSLTLLGNFSW
jgi:hypothetical protein